ncbi:hypothetical protein [Sodalis sp. (in: enterobacteria)]|uniref:hypothetical protein n=1 Tax=Sodalis sp. (in: enterobacteria) TaxID=1898979 RepID=UPI003F374501
MGGVSGKRAQAVPPAGGIGQRRLTLLAVYFAERLLFLGVNIVMPLRLASAGDIANAEIGLFYALLLVGYHGSPLFYSLLGRYATREQILILAVALELAALLLIIGGAVDNRLYRLALLAGLGAGGVSAMLNGLLAASGGGKTLGPGPLSRSLPAAALHRRLPGAVLWLAADRRLSDVYHFGGGRAAGLTVEFLSPGRAGVGNLAGRGLTRRVQRGAAACGR